jgi:enterochelin esterase family protein
MIALAELSIADITGIARSVFLYSSTAGSAGNAVFLLDAELYLERVQALEVVRRLHAARAMPPALYAFVAGGGGAARHVDYTCRDAFGDFVVHNVLPRLLDAQPQLGQFVIAGLSLSGLAAAHIALRHPGRLAAAICQSPSFWWEEERLRQSLPPATDGAAALWISVGDQETQQEISHPPSGLWQGSSQIDSCQRTCTALRDAGYRVQERVFAGGHDPVRWREDLALALPWALGGPA